MMSCRSFFCTCIGLLMFWPLLSRAELAIEISGGNAQQIPIVIPPVEGLAYNAPNNFNLIVAADLQRTGLFRIVRSKGTESVPNDWDKIDYRVWEPLHAQALVFGRVAKGTGNRLRISLVLCDTLKKNILLNLDYTITPVQLRWTAHKIADAIYQKLTGETGMFASRIAYVTRIGERYVMQVADSDGQNAVNVVSSSEPIISPAWSPDGQKIAYVSFEKKKPVVFVQSLITGERLTLASFKGNNSAPTWSPDGTKLAIVLTYNTNSQLYIINADATGLRQLEQSSAIDTEPSFSADGEFIYFSSDRGGNPQIYKVPVAGGLVSRVTFEGTKNLSARFSPDGKLLVMVREDARKFRIAVQEIDTGQSRFLTSGPQDESPTFSPNGRIILYVARRSSGQNILSAVSIDGYTSQFPIDSNIREPAWGPLLN